MDIQLPDTVRRGLRTFLQTFVGVYAITLMGFLGDVAKWADSTDQAFPSLNPLAKGAMAALTAAAAAVVSLIQNWGENKTGRAFLVAKSTPGVEATQEPGGTDAGPVVVQPSEES